ncbi:TonB-dependent receptor [Teredinibacter turnerae]|uniref:TonB-dependent receptor domain-containing protein n=1 Tax=Teredinibacter turnerae TaxID=2426 RepID=UPI000366320A|nr:TonB-dependent receptor [Teredinibacter turnerae]
MQKKYLSMAISGAISALIAGVQVSGAIAQEQSAELTEEVLVTGSRIYQPGLDSVTPVQVLNAADLDLGAEVNIGDAINQLPAAGTPLFNRTNSNFDISNSGVVNINLRDLASERTLVLVNGRRFVAGVPGTSAVDLNAIPSAMIQRVEITTGGNSAVYGSDAVAGVVNFVTKKNFEGVEFSSRYEVTGEGDGEEYDFGLMMGSNFSDEKGNATVFFGYTDQGAVYSRDRERTAIDATYPDDAVFGHEFPFYSSYPPQGRFIIVDDEGQATQYFTYRPGNDTPVGEFDTNGAGGIADGFNRSAYRLIAIPTERFLLATNTRYDFNDSVSGFIEGTYTTTKTASELEPFPFNSEDIFGSYNNGGIPLQYENSADDMITHPYMPQNIYDAATASGAQGLPFVRRLSEFGPRGSKNERQTFRTVFGLEGQFADDTWRWDVSYNYGQTTQAQVSEGQVDITAMRYALISEENPDNPGEIRCVDATARDFGCVPINVFGFNSISPEAIAYISADQSRNATVKQKVFQANIAGTLFELPMGDFSVATGIESRSESSEARNDALTVRGLNSSNASPNVQGQFDVNEVYAEVSIPLLKDTLVQSASLGLAGRASDYSTVGTTSTYEGKLDIKINDNILLRGSAAQAVRAPGVDELYDPGTQTFSQVNDPCAGVTANSQGVVDDNCRSIPEIAARIADSPTGEFELSQPELQGTTGFLGGNPELFEETANTYTFGFVHTPTYLPNSLTASVSVDYWDIQVEDAIFTITQDNVLDLCYGSASFPNNQFCDQIKRYPSNHPFRGALDEVNSGAANVGEISTSGIDVAIDLDYDLQTAFSVPGAISWNLAYTNLNKYKVVNVKGEAPDNERGEIGNAKNKFVSTMRYKLEDLTVQWQMRYIGKSRIEDKNFDAEDCAELECYTDAITYSDLQVRYTLRDIMSGKIELFAGVENMFDQDPPIISSGLADSDTGTETAAGVYDAIGRSFYAGFKAKF